MRIEARFNIITPVFMGGAEPKGPAELRPASIKGALRFWYRALMWPQLMDWKAVCRVEDELFGSTKGQGKFFLSVDGRVARSDKKWIDDPAISYLGYGLEDKTHRSLQPGQTFAVKLFFPEPSNTDTTAMITVVKALSMLGGLGARSRRGFGSVNLEALAVDDKEILQPPKSREELKAQISELTTGADSVSWPEYTALSKFSRIIILAEHNNAKAAQKYVGEQLMAFRRNISVDSRLVSQFANRPDIKPKDHPRRVAFGLPHNYFFRRKQGNVTVSISGRRASPLFVHIHQIGSKYVPVLSFLPGRFLPQRDKIKMRYRNNICELEPTVEKNSYGIINEFLDQLSGRLEVLPSDR